MALRYILKIIIILILFPINGLAANHYVRQAATGDGSGIDWDNAYGSMPAKLIRGDTYYIADGTYGPYTFDTSEVGDIYIYLRKATNNDHGTNIGWNESYGDDTAVFQRTDDGNIWIFRTGFWDINGAYGIDNGIYGFKLVSLSNNRSSSVKNIQIENDLGYLKFKYIELAGRGVDGDASNPADDLVYSSQVNAEHISFSHCYFHDSDRVPFHILRDDDFLLEHSYITRNESTSESHGEAIQANGDRGIVRYNKFIDIEGTGVIMMADGADWKVYGNIIAYTDNYPNTGQGGRGLSQLGGCGSTQNCSNHVWYNNTMYNLTGVNSVPSGGTQSRAYNNIWAKCVRMRWINIGSHDNNGFYDNIDDGNPNEDYMQVFNGNIFEDVESLNFRLIEPSNNGTILDEEFSMDLIGIVRGHDSNWDMGAYEYSENLNASDQKPSVPIALRVIYP